MDVSNLTSGSSAFSKSEVLKIFWIISVPTLCQSIMLTLPHTEVLQSTGPFKVLQWFKNTGELCNEYGHSDYRIWNAWSKVWPLACQLKPCLVISHPYTQFMWPDVCLNFCLLSFCKKTTPPIWLESDMCMALPRLLGSLVLHLEPCIDFNMNQKPGI